MAAIAGLVQTVTVRAEPVAVIGGDGQSRGNGFVFRHRNHCYLFVPQHIHGDRTSLSIMTAAPPQIAEAEIIRSFHPGHDLSLFYVLPGLEARCRDQWSDLPDRTDEMLDRSGSTMMTRVYPTGQTETFDMAVIFRGYDLLDARPVQGEIYQGTSGSILKSGGSVIGMAVRSENVEHAAFLRIDEIKSRLSRLLDARTPAVAAREEAASPPSPCANGGSLPVRSLTCSRPAASPEHRCSNLAKGSGAEFMPGPDPIEILIEFDVPDPVAVSSVQLLGQRGDAKTIPKSIRIDVDSSIGSAPRWRRFAAADVSPLGELTAKNGSKPFASRMRVVIEDTWDPEKNLRIECIAAMAN